MKFPEFLIKTRRLSAL